MGKITLRFLRVNPNITKNGMPISTSRFGARIEKNNPKKQLILAGIIVSLGLGVISFTLSGSEKQPSTTVSVQPIEDLVSVLVPVRDIQVGEQLNSSLFRFEKRLGSTLPKGTITSVDQIADKYARVSLTQGMIVTEEHIVSSKPTNLITANIPEGYRAVTIRVNETSSVEGWARPGANVDVLWVGHIGGKQGLTTIVENAKVLSAERQVDSNTPMGASVPSTVTLLVTSQDAAKIQLAATTGTLSLLLRGDSDLSSSGIKTALTIDDLLGRQTSNPDSKIKRGDGIVKIGDQAFYLIDGELVPAYKLQE